ncbi:hypothetical protein E3N88_35198 [Mikania micrantha]|uniref:J domain-containing protein n=1 Tax=Mikania micrantha TaxID=192012 RepID=A0A5N6M0F2_9ASTR|nr:hypothetical protein E3N88_35198 [Mikania micrantha]
MDPQSFIARAEAQRWLGIAEKLLIGHDLVGSKTFAIRARESDPRLEAAEQILAIADTLLAAEKRVVGTNGAHQPDYYAILQLVRFVQDTDHIASQYRRLAVALNPHQNRFPYADQAFQLVNDAWAVLSNPMRKSMYDSDLDYPQQQMNNLGPLPVREQEHVFQHREQEQLFQQQQQQLQEEQRKQEQLLEEQRKQEQLLEEQRKQQQLQEEQRKQQQLQEEQRKQELLQQEQQQDSARQSAAPVPHPYNGVRDEGTEPEAETEVVDDSPTFWTACPYCFYMYEYPKVYVECTLRCDNCKRAFQAVRISSPPPIIEGQDAYFYCWGFIPVGLSMSPLQKSNNRGRNSNWTPFSSLHNTSNNVQNHLNEQAAPKENLFVNKSSGPRIYIDDITDDMFIGISDPSSDSDTDWGGTKKQKSKRMDKGFKERIQVLALRAVYAKNSSVKNLKHGIPVQKGVEVPTVLVVETSKINVGSNPRKKPGRVAQERGKLDLNVEFNNNDGEETAPRMTAVTHVHEQGDEDNIEEGIEFFEGLDEYLSSLPILSVVNEEKDVAAWPYIDILLAIVALYAKLDIVVHMNRNHIKPNKQATKPHVVQLLSF